MSLVANDNDEEVACPVCGKKVGLDVPSCPNCGAEFEEEEAEETPGAAEAQPVGTDEGDEVACPVCGCMVGLEVTACPRCGAEFEEEEIEEVIEVEEKVVFEEVAPAPAKPKPAAKPKAKPAEKPRARPAERPKPKPRPAAAAESPFSDLPATIMDFRVLGIALILLGIVGAQVALMIDWYWSWVPPIEDNMGMFVAIPVLVLVVGLLVFMLVKKALSSGKSMPGMMPGTALALFVFGILALIVVMLWDPINSALQDSKMTVAAGFIVALVVGVLLLFMGMRSASDEAACR